MNKPIIITLLLFIWPFLAINASETDENTYPTPERLFHIARSINKNLVCYDVNLKDGKLDTKHPLNPYWVNREEHPGETNGLNFFQRKMAYGYKVIDAKEDMCICTLSASKDQKLIITQYNNQWVCLTEINKQKAVLKELYVKSKPHNGMKVEYVELRGIAIATKLPITERIEK